MKTQILILALMIGLGMTSCIEDDNIPTPNNPNNDPVNVVNSSWMITYFWDSDHEETNHFTGFIFTFEDGGILKATNGTNTYAGTWTEGNDDSTAKLILNFTNPSDFEEISDDWHVLEWTDSTIRLQDVSGGNGGIDILTFEKV